MKPQVPIEVDETSGVWTTDGLPMLYVPRHFFVNNHTAIEAALGREKYAELLYESGYKSAYYWCSSESATHGLAGLAVFEHYLKRLSQRGWGKFSFTKVDAREGIADIRLDHSAFVLARPELVSPKLAGPNLAGPGGVAPGVVAPGNGGELCYMFAGWFSGAMDWVLEAAARPIKTLCAETQCAAQGHPHCGFSVRAHVSLAPPHPSDPPRT